MDDYKYADDQERKFLKTQATKVAERIADVADRADNYFAAAQLPMTAQIHQERLAIGMEKIRNNLRALYVELTDENPWEE